MKTKILVTAMAAVMTLAGPASAEKVLSFGYQNNEESFVNKGILEMKSTLEALSGGEMSLELFPNAQLGDFKAMNAQVQGGELDLVVNGYSDMSYVIPELNMVGAPYAITDFDHFERVVSGTFGQKMDEKFAAEGVKVLDIWYFGTRQTTSNKAINSIEDMAGLRLRVPNVPFLIAFAENTGASAAPVAFQEVYLALQTNQVDGQENPLPTIRDMKFYEVQSHVALTNHFIASQSINISLDTWNGLSAQEQAWLMAAIKAGGEHNDKLTRAAEANLIAEFEAAGLTVTQPDTAPFQAAMKPYYDELDAQFGEGSMAEIINE